MKNESSPWWRHLSRSARRIVKSHPLACLSVGLTVALVSVTILLLAQRARADEPADTLAVALTLYEQGAFRDAQPLFAAIDPANSAHDLALAYDALCRYETSRADGTNSYEWFFDVLNTPRLQQASLPSDLRETLRFDDIDARYRSGRFGSPDIIPLIDGFQTAYPASARLEALGEFKLAAWFERGIQRVYMAGLGEHQRFYKSWTDGREHLEQFLSLVDDFPKNAYAALADRSLAEDLQVALVVLGEEPTALADIPVENAARASRYGVVRMALHQKLHPEAWKQNLQLLTNAQTQVQALPVSRDRSRLVRHLADFGFLTGERLCAEAAGAPPTDVVTIAAKRAAASEYFQNARTLQQQVVAHDWKQTSPTAMAILWTALYNSYSREQDYERLLATTSAQLTNAAPGTLSWLAARLYQGVALSEQMPRQFAAGAVAFDEVLSYGFKGKHQFQDHLTFLAARWRVHVARLMNDSNGALSVVQWVEQGDGAEKVKERFLADHEWVVAWAGAN